MRVTLEEVSEAAVNPVQLERGWKLFLLLPRMLLHRRNRNCPRDLTNSHGERDAVDSLQAFSAITSCCRRFGTKSHQGIELRASGRVVISPPSVGGC